MSEVLEPDYEEMCPFLKWYATLWQRWYGHKRRMPEEEMILCLYWSWTDKSGRERKYGSGPVGLKYFYERLQDRPYANAILRLSDINRITKERYNILGFRLDFDSDCPFQNVEEVTTFLGGIELYPVYVMQTGVKSFHCLFLIDWTVVGSIGSRHLRTNEVLRVLKAINQIVDSVPHVDRSANPFEIKVPGSISKGKFLVKGYLCLLGKPLDVIQWVEKVGINIPPAVPVAGEQLSFFEDIRQQKTEFKGDMTSDHHVWILQRQAEAEEVIKSFLQETLSKHPRQWIEPVAKHLASKLNTLANGTERISGEWLGCSLLGGTRQWGDKIIGELLRVRVLRISGRHNWGRGQVGPDRKPYGQATSYSWHEYFTRIFTDHEITWNNFSGYDEYPPGMSWELASHDIWCALHKGWNDDDIIELVNNRLGDANRQDAAAMVRLSRINFDLHSSVISGSDGTPAHP